MSHQICKNPFQSRVTHGRVLDLIFISGTVKTEECGADVWTTSSRCLPGGEKRLMTSGRWTRARMVHGTWIKLPLGRGGRKEACLVASHLRHAVSLGCWQTMALSSSKLKTHQPPSQHLTQVFLPQETGALELSDSSLSCCYSIHLRLQTPPPNLSP